MKASEAKAKMKRYTYKDVEEELAYIYQEIQESINGECNTAIIEADYIRQDLYRYEDDIIFVRRPNFFTKLGAVINQLMDDGYQLKYSGSLSKGFNNKLVTKCKITCGT